MSIFNPYPVRIPQLIGVFGPGAMVNFPDDETFVIADVEFWDYGTSASQHVVDDDRLRQRLGVDELRSPPVFGGEERRPVAAFRFPGWHYCRRCGEMRQITIGRVGRSKCRGRLKPCSESKFDKETLIPVRFITVCESGHLDEFPFREWAHGGKPCIPDARLRYSVSGRTAALSGIYIQCADCGRSRSLGGSFSSGDDGGPIARIGITCRGYRPWRGGEEAGCSRELRVVQRGASNVYFPVTRSSIHLPVWADRTPREVAAVIENPRIWKLLSSGQQNGEPLADRVEEIANAYGVDSNLLAAASREKIRGVVEASNEPQSEEEYRSTEYLAFLELEGSQGADLHICRRSATDYSSTVSDAFDVVCFVNKLRETRALSGFARLMPPSSPDDNRIVSLDSGSGRSWLPVAVVRGEGLFLRFRADRIDEWVAQRSVQERFAKYASGLSGWMVDRAREISPKYLLLHTFAHLLIRQISLDCGYGTASLRERIYCDSGGGTVRMEGILVYTSSGDSEGTMGGLVRQGEPGRLEAIIHEALRKATWCSSDPICIESRGQGSDNANLAACHACALLPETSCEVGNRVLDRGFVVGAPDEAVLGYFVR